MTKGNNLYTERVIDRFKNEVTQLHTYPDLPRPPPPHPHHLGRLCNNRLSHTTKAPCFSYIRVKLSFKVSRKIKSEPHDTLATPTSW